MRYVAACPHRALARIGPFLDEGAVASSSGTAGGHAGALRRVAHPVAGAVLTLVTGKAY